jgi:muramoyltetrapeptide carboxypeptidase
MRLIPELLKLKAPARAKVLLGFSDITALHLFVNQHWGWASVHGRNISSMHPGPQSKDRAALRKLLFGATPSVTFRKLRPLNDAAATDRTLRAPVMGGNLRLLQTSLGTSWELQTRNRIVFIEDVGERGYSVHRMLEQLYQTGHLRQGLKALVVGQFTESLEKDGRDLVPEALERFARMVRFPVLTGLPCGHGDVNYPVPFNAPAELSLGKKAALSIDSGGR